VSRCWRVVERRPGVWFVEAMPVRWHGAFRFDPVEVVGPLDVALGEALHRAGLDGASVVWVWPAGSDPWPVELSGVLPVALAGASRSHEVQGCSEVGRATRPSGQAAV
jgi:hypothetical protein